MEQGADFNCNNKKSGGAMRPRKALELVAATTIKDHVEAVEGS